MLLALVTGASSPVHCLGRPLGCDVFLRSPGPWLLRSSVLEPQGPRPEVNPERVWLPGALRGR